MYSPDELSNIWADLANEADYGYDELEDDFYDYELEDNE